jgi:ParB family chromosome partitioning protein
VGRSRVAVVNTVRLLRLPDPVKVLLSQGSLSEGHARALLALPDDDLIVKAAQQVVVRDLTVRQTEELVRRLAAADKTPLPVPAETAPGDDPDTSHTRQLEDAFRNALGTKVSLSRGSRGGRLVITFYSEEELQAIYERIVGTA